MSEIGQAVFLPRLHRHLRGEAPHAGIRAIGLAPHELEDALQDGRVDAVLGYYPDLDSNAIYQQRLYSHDLTGVVRHGHPIAARRMTLQQFMACEHILVRDGGRSQETFEQELAVRKIERKIALRTSHYMGLPNLIVSGDLPVVVPPALAELFVAGSEVRIVEPPFAIRKYDWKQYWHRRYSDDPKSMWLRGLIGRLFIDRPSAMLAGADSHELCLTSRSAGSQDSRMQLIQRFERNTAGRDFAVGDIHGHFTRLQAALDGIGFDPAADRLFSVGDLVDRGPESGEVLRWLAYPWFHAVRGNHEDIAVRHVKIGKVDTGNYLNNGGAWFLELERDRQVEFATAFEALPLAMEVETAAGLVGLLHADCPAGDWANLEAKLVKRRSARDRAMWSRNRIESDDTSGVKGVHAVVVGHTPVRVPVVLGNVYHIDTRGWKTSGYFTVVDLNKLKSGELSSAVNATEALPSSSIASRLMAALRGMARSDSDEK